MAWYRTGTVTVTQGSMAVVGVQTLWLTNVKAGDLFSLGGTIYEVASIETNTALTLKSAYQEASAAAASYYIIPLSEKWQLSTETAAAVAALVSQMNTRFDDTYTTVKGDKGDPGLTMRGNYAASSSYAPLDIVNYSSKTWMCKLGCTGQAPAAGSAYWSEITTTVINKAGGRPA